MKAAHFKATDGSLLWKNAECQYARPFHCPGSRANFLAALRPAWMMRAEHVVAPIHLKLGECVPGLFVAPTRFVELMALPQCRAVDSGSSMTYEVRYRDATITCRFAPLAEVPGFLCAMSANRVVPDVHLAWEYGGLDQSDVMHCPWEPAQR